MYLATVDIYNLNKHDIAGLINVNHVEAVSVFRDIGAAIGGIIGNKSELLTKKLNDAYDGAFRAIQQAAVAKYPNAAGIVGIRTQLDKDETGFVSVMITGTVIVPKRPGMQGGRRLTRRKVLSM